jgi:hypothetical protein
VLLGASTEATEVYTSEVTFPTLVVWGIAEPTGVEVTERVFGDGT